MVAEPRKRGLPREEFRAKMVAGKARAKAEREAAASGTTDMAQINKDLARTYREIQASAPPQYAKLFGETPDATAERLAVLIAETVACKHILVEIRDLLSSRSNSIIPAAVIAGLGDIAGFSIPKNATQTSDISNRHARAVTRICGPHGVVDCGRCNPKPPDVDADELVAAGLANGAATHYIQARAVALQNAETDFINMGPVMDAAAQRETDVADTPSPIWGDPVFAEMAAELAEADGPVTDPPEVIDEVVEETWRKRLSFHRRNRMWVPDWGPEPGHDGCLVPERLLR